MRTEIELQLPQSRVLLLKSSAKAETLGSSVR
jgi:hypothetical protein